MSIAITITNKCRIHATYADLIASLTEEEKQWSLNNPIEFMVLIQKKYSAKSEREHGRQ